MNDIDLVPIYPGSGAPGKHVEERIRFESVCDNVINPCPTMLELGCFWAMWTIIFGKRFPNAHLIVLEGNSDKLAVGLTNLSMNGLSAKAYFNTINSQYSLSKPEFGDLVQDITLAKIFEIDNIKAIDILHLDIQGAEENFHKEIISYLSKGLIHNVVMGTHSEPLHQMILNDLDILNKHFIIENIPYIKGLGDGEIIIKRKYL